MSITPTPFILKQETSFKSLIHFFSQTELSNFKLTSWNKFLWLFLENRPERERDVSDFDVTLLSALSSPPLTPLPPFLLQSYDILLLLLEHQC